MAGAALPAGGSEAQSKEWEARRWRRVLAFAVTLAFLIFNLNATVKK